MILNPNAIRFVILFVAIFVGLTTLTFLQPSWVRIDGIWFIFPFAAIRVSTVLTAIWTFVLVLFLQQKRVWVSIYFASLAVVFSLGLFEIVWYYSAAAFRGYDLRIFEFSALLGWVFLGLREVIHKKPSKISIVFYALYAVSMGVWIGLGLPSNDIGNSNFSVSVEIVNVLSKFSLATAYGLHVGHFVTKDPEKTFAPKKEKRIYG